jgi:hypothetical protein
METSPIPRPYIHRFLAAALALAVFVSLPACQSTLPALPPAGHAHAEEENIHSAKIALRMAKHAKTHDESIAYSLLAAEIAWDLAWAEYKETRVTPVAEEKLTVYRDAVLQLIEKAREHPKALQTPKTRVFPGPRDDYALSIDPRNAAVLRDFPELLPASNFKGKKGFEHRIIRRGLGLRLVGINKDLWLSKLISKDNDFKRKTGYTAPRTALVLFGPPPKKGEPREVSFAIVDPRKEKEFAFGDRMVPVAADFTAPIIAAYPEFGSQWQALFAAIKPDGWLKRSGLYSLEGYDPERIPVLLVHGLLSTPDMWKNLINEMNAAEGVGDKYQFFVYTYPTGLAPAYTSLLFRESLARAHAATPNNRGFVIIAHSMGGILARTDATDTGRVIWDAYFKDKADEAWALTTPKDLIRRTAVFSHDPILRRIIFISVPHKGSPVASKGFVQTISAIIRAPLDLTMNLANTPLQAMHLIPPRVPTSAQGLSPDSPFLQGLSSLPIQTHYNSIIGDRGLPGPLEDSSDGIVPYWSSHVEGADSELIVPSDHGAFEDPAAVKEIIRILRKEASKEHRGNN